MHDRIVRSFHPGNTDGIHVSIEHKGTSPTDTASYGDYAGAPWYWFVDLDIESDLLKPVSNEASDSGFTCAARHQVGINGVDRNKLS